MTEDLDQINATEYVYESPLAKAIREGSQEQIEYLLDNGALINDENSAIQPLVAAIKIQNNKLIDYLIDNGAKINPIYKNCQSTPIAESISSGNTTLTKELVEKYNAELNKIPPNSNSLNNDPGIVAILQHDLDTLKYLVEKGLDLTKKVLPCAYLFCGIHFSNGQEDIIEFLLSQKNIDLTSPDQRIPDMYNTPIRELISMQKFGLVNKMVELGVEMPKEYLPSSFYLEKFKSANNSEIKKTILELVETCGENINNRSLVNYIISSNEKKFISILNKDGDFKQVKNQLIKYSIKWHAKFQNKDIKVPLILTSQSSLDESAFPNNYSDLKEKCATFFSNNKVYNKQNNKVVDDGISIHYVISKTGTLYLHQSKEFSVHHSYFLKGKEGKDLYGYGKAVACGGHLDIKDGKIIRIDNQSGHYQPNTDQMKVSAYYLKSQGVLDTNAKIELNDQSSNFSYEEIDILPIGDILDQYANVEY